jgi:hypothetical protein
MLVDKMSSELPFKGGISPSHAHSEPILPYVDLSALNERMHGEAINLNTIEDFVSLNTDI